MADDLFTKVFIPVFVCQSIYTSLFSHRLQTSSISSLYDGQTFDECFEFICNAFDSLHASSLSLHLLSQASFDFAYVTATKNTGESAIRSVVENSSLSVQAALEIKKAQALDYLAAQQAQQQWDLERPLDRFIVPLDQVALPSQDTAAEALCYAHEMLSH